MPAYRSCYSLTDHQIRGAVPFEGYDPIDRTRWPAPYYPWSPASGPATAYHVQRLAAVMTRLGRWVGPPPQAVAGSDTLWDGNHRLRAVEYLAARGVRVEVPAVEVVG